MAFYISYLLTRFVVIDTFTLDAGSANITFKTVGFNILEPGITALDHVGQNYLQYEITKP